jgi:Transposase
MPLDLSRFLRQTVKAQNSLNGENLSMSRRQFTKEFKLAAVRQLERGISITEVARWSEGRIAELAGVYWGRQEQGRKMLRCGEVTPGARYYPRWVICN